MSSFHSKNAGIVLAFFFDYLRGYLVGGECAAAFSGVAFVEGGFGDCESDAATVAAVGPICGITVIPFAFCSAM
jgi:hypothetical protein